MLGTLGTPEMIFIFLLALLLFGPKKLPEIGRTVGKALTEFRRASGELKATFDREMNNLEHEAGLKDAGPSHFDNHHYDYSSYEPSGELPYTADNYLPAPTESSTTSASASLGAESSLAAAPEGAIAHGSVITEPHPVDEEHLRPGEANT